MGTLKFTWKIKNFSKIQATIIYSDVSSVGPYKWKIRADPKGNSADNYMSVYLEVADSEILPLGWSRKAKFSFILVNQIDKKSSLTKVVGECEFKGKIKSLGFASFISHKDLHDPKKGYLVNDTCIIEANVTVYGDASVGKDEPTAEDMDAFFGDLNSMIFPKKIVSSKEEAKEALTIIQGMAPADMMNSSGRMSQLLNAFDVLSLSLDDGLLTLEQKEQVLFMKHNFIALSERAAQVIMDKMLFNEKELKKTTLDCKLRKCLIDFEKAKAETLQHEQKIAILQAQIDDSKREMENSASKQTQTFQFSKELKAELDVLVRNWPEYEAKMKAAEDEEKIVGTEWSNKMKQLVSYLNKSFHSI